MLLSRLYELLQLNLIFQLWLSELHSETINVRSHSKVVAILRYTKKSFVCRHPDAEGKEYWMGRLTSGAETRAEALLGFAESDENKILFSEMTGVF